MHNRIVIGRSFNVFVFKFGYIFIAIPMCVTIDPIRRQPFGRHMCTTFCNQIGTCNEEELKFNYKQLDCIYLPSCIDLEQKVNTTDCPLYSQQVLTRRKERKCVPFVQNTGNMHTAHSAPKCTRCHSCICPRRWNKLRTSCYWYKKNPGTLESAEGMCKKETAHLVEFRNADDIEKILSFIKHKVRGNDFWIGGKHYDEGEWKWQRSQAPIPNMTFCNVAPERKKDSNLNACLAFDLRAKCFQVSPCYMQKGFACERRCMCTGSD